MQSHYDAIIVGGRCAGAATAMLLARGGMRVLLLEAARPGTDTLSTLALMRGGVLQIHRWGLLDAVVSAGTPAITSTEFAYGDGIETVEIKPGGGISALRAPRRTVLDTLLLEAARAAGAEVRMPTRVTRVLTDGERVCGIEGIDRAAGTCFRATAPLVVGADGRNSTVAKAVDAPFRLRGEASSAVVYGYFPGLPRDRYHWAYRPGVAAGVVPTGDGLACVWASTSSARFAHRNPSGLDATFRRLLTEAEPELGRRIGTEAPVGTLRAFPGRPGWMRASAGPGWALVGDAGYFKDPITAHGITDALRDAELLSRAVLEAPRGNGALRAAVGDYERTRDRLSRPLFEVTEQIATYSWDLAELRELLRKLSHAMKPDVAILRGFDQSPAA